MSVVVVETRKETRSGQWDEPWLLRQAVAAGYIGLAHYI